MGPVCFSQGTTRQAYPGSEVTRVGSRCAKRFCYDANVLYLSMMAKNMPCRRGRVQVCDDMGELVWRLLDGTGFVLPR